MKLGEKKGGELCEGKKGYTGDLKRKRGCSPIGVTRWEPDLPGGRGGEKFPGGKKKKRRK